MRHLPTIQCELKPGFDCIMFDYIVSAGGGLMILAQEQDKVGGKFSALESFRGRMTRLNFWNHTLAKVVLPRQPSSAKGVAGQLMRSCADVPGNVFSWGDAVAGASGLARAPAPLSPCGACPRPEAPTRGGVRMRRGGREVAEFSCQEGFMLDTQLGRRKDGGGEKDENEGEDDGVRRCGVLGEWDRPLPNCTGEAAYSS